MADNYFSDQLAFGLANFSSYTRGKEYFEDGCVEKIWKQGQDYKAIVTGTHPYQVSLKFEGEDLIYSCSCPFELGGACKHVVAAIFAFAADKKFANPPQRKRIDKNASLVKRLLSKTADSQLRLFLEKILSKQPDLVEELKIFLQGQQQTPITISDYKTKFRTRLDQLNLRGLLEMWYQEGQDYYDDQYYDFAAESLEDVVADFLASGEKYDQNQNLGEALKIYQAIFETLFEKMETIPDDLSDLSDWFGQQMDKALDFYIKTLVKTDNKNLKHIGIKFLCSVFQNSSIYIGKHQLLTGLKLVVVNQEEAQSSLGHLGFKTKTSLSAEESSLLAFLYFLAEDWLNFETASLKNLKQNPSLTLDLLKYYQKNDHKTKIIQVADQVLNSLTPKDKFSGEFISDHYIDYQNIEIPIRRFLKNIYSLPQDYPMVIDNLEKLFLATGSLADYQELIKIYKTQSEKEKFWSVIKKHFGTDYDVKKIFKVFRLENQKPEILELIKTYPSAECFPEMVASIREDFPLECFNEYKKKIEDTLVETKVEKYSQAAYHLKRMKEIGLDKEFADFINWIKTAYWRRRRLLEELQTNQL